MNKNKTKEIQKKLTWLARISKRIHEPRRHKVKNILPRNTAAASIIANGQAN